MGTINYSKPGIIDGPAKYYYPDGRIRTIGRYKNGQEIGLWYRYDTTGKLLTIEAH